MPAYPPSDKRNALLDSYELFYDQPLASRSSLLPFGTYQNSDNTESAGWAWPQMALDALEAAEIPGRYLSGDPNQAVTREDAQRTAINASGLMMGGGLLSPKPAAGLARGVADAEAYSPSIFDRGISSYKSMRYGSEPSAFATMPPEMLRHIDRTNSNTRLAGTPANADLAGNQIERALALENYDSLFSHFPDVANRLDNTPVAGGPEYLSAVYAQNAPRVSRPSLSTVYGGQHDIGKAAPFIDNGFRPSEGASVTHGSAYERYRNWASARGLEPITDAQFRRAMTDAGFTSQRLAGANRYIGIEDAELFSNGSRGGAGVGMGMQQDPYPWFDPMIY